MQVTSRTLYQPKPQYLCCHIHFRHDIKPPVSDIAPTVSFYLCISYTTQTLCVTSQTLYVWHHSQYAWHHMNTLWHHTRIGMTSQRVYLWHHNNIYDIKATVFMKTQRIYLTFHPIYLTSQPLYLCCHTHCIFAITTIMEVIPLGTWMTSYTLYMTSQSHFMTPFLSI